MSYPPPLAGEDAREGARVGASEESKVALSYSAASAAALGGNSVTVPASLSTIMVRSK
jgi:hypothetical protein